MEEDSMFGLIQEYLDRPLPANWDKMDLSERRYYLRGGDFGDAVEGTERRMRVCVAEIWQELYGRDAGTMQAYNAREIHDIMQRMPGWKRAPGKIRFSSYGVQRGYVREDNYV